MIFTTSQLPECWKVTIPKTEAPRISDFGGFREEMMKDRQISVDEVCLLKDED